jgi:hypothetical protein
LIALVAADHETWMRWFETSDRQSGDDKIGKTRVSTVFLCIDHNFYGSSGPVLFQTLISDGPLADEMWRYSTYAEAERGHQVAVTQARGAGLITKPAQFDDRPLPPRLLACKLPFILTYRRV